MEQAYRSHPLVTFFVLAFAITWVVWIPRASGVPLGVLGQVWTWIPAIAALLAAALTGGRGAVRDLGARLVRWRVGWQWYAVVILGPAVFSLAVAGVYVLLGGSWAAALPPVLLGEAALVMLPGAANLFNVSPNVISAGDLTLPLLVVAAKGFLIGVLILVVGPNLARGPRPEALPQT